MTTSEPSNTHRRCRTPSRSTGPSWWQASSTPRGRLRSASTWADVHQAPRDVGDRQRPGPAVGCAGTKDGNSRRGHPVGDGSDPPAYDAAGVQTATDRVWSCGVVMTVDDGFGDFFRTVTGLRPPAPYDYQRRPRRKPCGDDPRSLAVNVPRDAGKMAACRVIGCW